MAAVRKPGLLCFLIISSCLVGSAAAAVPRGQDNCTVELGLCTDLPDLYEYWWQRVHNRFAGALQWSQVRIFRAGTGPSKSSCESALLDSASVGLPWDGWSPDGGPPAPGRAQAPGYDRFPETAARQDFGLPVLIGIASDSNCIYAGGIFTWKLRQ